MVAARPDPQAAVRVLTPEGDPIPGVEVLWTPSEGAGSATPSTTSDGDGVAVAEWTLGEQAGTQRISAGLANGAEVTIEATAAPGVVSVLEGPERVLVEVGMATPAPIRLLDAFGNEVPPSRATWSTASTDVASVDGAGVVSGVVVGLTELHVDVDGRRAVVPLEVRPIFRLTQIAAGLTHACGLADGGAAYCWGRSRDGALGNGSSEPVDGAVRVLSEVPFSSLSLGDAKSCAVAVSGRGYCWGWKGHSLLGDSVFAGDALVPEPIALDVPLRALEASLHHGQCAVTIEGDAYCWGHNDTGQIGQGFESSTVFTPRRLSVDGPVRGVALSPFHGCAVLESGSTWCWGSAGRLGANEDLGVTYPPIQVAGTQEFGGLVRGFDGTCGLTADSRAFCWGGGAWEGIEPRVDFPRIPTEVANFRFRRLASARNRMCGILLAGEAGCWDGASSEMAPFVVPGVTQFSMGWFLACALDSDGAPYCWGGDFPPTPTRVYARIPPE
ncbi:MAG: hypothetical protein ABFS34_11885 [Gemmatimonadota bacterium]